jgi:quercetin 2,3-dioxygenase
MVESQSIFKLQRGKEHAYFDHGWLKTYHSFSFADYMDPMNINWGALRVLNDDTVAPGMGFGTHPHQDMEIVTYVLDGELEHKDSTGAHGVVGPGGVQYMSAGTGVRHSEFNHSKVNPLHFLQMWVLPGKLGVPPSYGQANFSEDRRHNKWLVVASNATGSPDAIELTQDAVMSVAHVADGSLNYDFASGRLGFLFVATGSAKVDVSSSDGSTESYSLNGGDSARISGVSHFTIAGDAEVVLWDVPPMHTEVMDV